MRAKRNGIVRNEPVVRVTNAIICVVMVAFAAVGILWCLVGLWRGQGEIAWTAGCIAVACLAIAIVSGRVAHNSMHAS